MVDTVDSKSTRCKSVEVQILSRLPIDKMININKLYLWTLNKAKHPKAPWFLGFISFIESSVFPIPPDVLLVPMMIVKKNKIWLLATICTLSSVLGAIIGYLIGAFLFESFGTYIINFYNFSDKFDQYKFYYDEYSFWLVLIAGFSPFPYKIITIASGFFSLNIFIFIILSIIARGLRYFLIGFLIWYFGKTIEKFIEKNLNTLTIIFIVVLIIIFITYKIL